MVPIDLGLPPRPQRIRRAGRLDFEHLGTHIPE
jgi:hypothetical protein